MRIHEVKRHLDGREERFDCRLVLRRRHVVVVRFDLDRELRAGGIRVPKGTRSYGFFWRRRSYVMYRMLDGQRRPIAHRYDVVEDVRIGEEDVSYRDLLLDLWFDREGAVRVEDEAEVAQATHAGMLSPRQRERIAATRDLLLRQHAVIEREAARLLAPSDT